MTLDDELQKMDLVEVKKYKANEKFKAVLGGGASLVDLTTLPGVIVGGIGGGVIGGLGGLAIGLTAGEPFAAGIVYLLGVSYYGISGAWIGGGVALLADGYIRV